MTVLIAFADRRWNDADDVPQQLLQRLAQAARWRVVYVEPPRRHQRSAAIELEALSTTVDVMHVWVPDEAVADDGSSGLYALLAPLFGDALRSRGIDGGAATIAWFVSPLALPLMATCRPKAVVYHAVTAAVSADAQACERALLQASTLVLAGGLALYEALSERHRYVHFLPPAVDANRFAPSLLRSGTAESQRAGALQPADDAPRLGYAGVIDDRLDWELITLVAERKPFWNFVFAGPIADDVADKLPRRPNIHWIAAPDAACLPYLMAGWHACLLPYALNDGTRMLTTGAALDGIAAERPIVATAVYDLVALYGDVIEIARDAEGFVVACEQVLTESRHRRQRRLGHMLGAVMQASWADRVAAVKGLLERLQAATHDENAEDAAPDGETAVPGLPVAV